MLVIKVRGFFLDIQMYHFKNLMCLFLMGVHLFLWALLLEAQLLDILGVTLFICQVILFLIPDPC